MTVTGWSDEGTKRLLCADVDSGSVSVFMGQPWPRTVRFSPLLPTVTIGAADVSMELWALRRYGNSPGGDENFHTGVFEDVADQVPRPFLGILWDGNADLATAIFSLDATPNFPDVDRRVAGTPARSGKWNHYVVNCDRDGNMEFFIDLASQGTISIVSEAGAVPVGSFHALTDDHASSTGPHEPGALEDYFINGSIFPVMVGPVAIHSRLMTAAEREASFLSKTVQSFGSGSTVIRFDWSSFEGDVSWDSDLSRCPLTVLAGLQVPVVMPKGAPGTVKVLDSSGNARHWNLDTVLDYSLYVSYDPGVGTSENGIWPSPFGVAPEIR